MPFLSGNPQLEQTGEREWTLLADVVYRDPDTPDAGVGDVWIAPAGMTTDLASVPAVAWGVLSPSGLHTRPAIIHDHLSQSVPDELAQSPLRCREWRAHRQVVDRRFRSSMIEVGVPRFRAALLWMGAVVGRWWVHGHPLQVVAMVVQLAATYACIVAGLALLPSWWSFVLIAGPALLAFLWGRDRAAMWVAQYPGLVLIALGVVTAAVSLTEWALSQLSGPRETIRRREASPVPLRPVPAHAPQTGHPVPEERASEHQT
ncbi:DUF1353 domain-containing protein [Demequina sp. NBRC 110052]|uniref:DUF1353 domain-containing protein n=1 Tax=Demequina sp. NBRC 110052 TaxID=1570341 RepID=UPI0013566977|nr:DUF1353 domain-containing protein [Demequina sp. NBRC 110052]